MDDSIIQESPYGSVVEVSSDSANRAFNSTWPNGLQANNLTVMILEADTGMTPKLASLISSLEEFWLVSSIHCQAKNPLEQC